ncbi:unnamed protein product, partial [Phaeothamnion confervicola]
QSALAGTDAVIWLKAMQEELGAHELNRTWVKCTSPPPKRLIGCRWVFAIKRAANGAMLRYKARLVAQGFSQRPGVDYDVTYAPVMTADAMRLLLALAAEFGFEIHQLDVVTAYLNAVLEEELYMSAP